MVRLVFRPYTQVWRSICTSESLRASTRVSSGFALLKHSSPSFGSQQMCSYSNLSKSRIGRSMMRSSTEVKEISPQLRRAFTFIVPAGFNHPKTRTHVRLLGPCFKTGRMKPYDRQQPKHIVCVHATNSLTKFKRTACSPLWSRQTEATEASPWGHVLRHLCRIQAGTSQDITLKPATFLRGVSLGSNTCWRALTGNATTRNEWRTPTVHSDPYDARTHYRSPESRQCIANSMRFPPNGFTYY